MTLRPYQEQQAEAALARLMQGRRGSVVMATGTGKTRTAAAIIERFGRPTLWLTDQRSLVDQTAPRVNATVATIQSAPQGRYGLVVVDEAHNFLTEKRTAFIDALDASVLALTATPERGDGRSIYDVYGPPVAEPYSIGQAIADGYLVDCRLVAFDVEGVDLTQVRIKGEDFDTESLARVMNQADVTRRIVDRWEAMRQGLANFYCCNRAHADAVAEELAHRGYRAVSIHRGHKDADERLAMLRAGAYDAVTSVQLVSEGFDHPPLQTLVNCRPMRSRRLYIQCLGRALRLSEGKTCALWLDAGGTTEATADVRRVLEPTETEPRTLDPKPRPVDALLSDVIVEARELGTLAGVQRRGFHRVELDGRELEARVTSRGVLVVGRDPLGGLSVSHVEVGGIRAIGRQMGEAEAWRTADAHVDGKPMGKPDTLRRLRELMRHHQPPTQAQVYALRQRGIEVPKTHAQAQRAIRRMHACAR